MVSQIDPTVPVHGAPTTESVRANMQVAQIEITNLQAATVGAPFLSIAGGTMNGPIYLRGDPTDPRQAATKAYVDAGGSGGGSTGIPEAPADGKSYGRNEGAWEPVMDFTGGDLTGPLGLPNGTAAAAALQIGGPNYGLYRNGNSLFISIAGQPALAVDALGLVPQLDLDMRSTHKIINLATPTLATDASTKAYVDAHAWLEAPNDANTYGRRAAVWVQAVPFAPRGNLAPATTEPSNVALPVANGVHIFSWTNSFYNAAYNSYYDGTGWRYRSTGYTTTASFDPNTGNTNWNGSATGTAGSPLTGVFSQMILGRDGGLTLATNLSAGGVVYANQFNCQASAYFATAIANNYTAFASASWIYLQFETNYYWAWNRVDGTINWVGAAGTRLTVGNDASQFFGHRVLLNASNGDPSFACLVPGVGAGGMWFNASGYFLGLGSTDGNGVPSSNWLMLNGTTGYMTLIWGTAYKPGGGTWTDNSDDRIKTVTRDYETGLDAILRLNPVHYKFKGNDVYSGDPALHGHTDTTTEYIGLVAQQVEAVAPEMVKLNRGYIDGKPVTDMRALDLTALPLALVNAMKEMDARVTALETRRN